MHDAAFPISGLPGNHDMIGIKNLSDNALFARVSAGCFDAHSSNSNHVDLARAMISLRMHLLQSTPPYGRSGLLPDLGSLRTSAALPRATPGSWEWQ